MDVHQNADLYVCISHGTIAPCEHEGQHLISNWAADVQKILETMEKQ
jgi:hypothetical protein